MADDGYKTILRTTDPTQGELVAEMLRREGIDARFHQVRGTLIGIAGNLIEMTVDVPAEKEARARELLADLEYVGASEALEAQAAGGSALDTAGAKPARAKDERADAEGPLHSRRHPLFAAAFALFLPGGGHLYARRPWTALIFAVGIVGCFAALVAARDTSVAQLVVPVLICIVSSDAIDGVGAARAEARGQHPARRRQLSRGFVLLAIAIAMGIGARLVAMAPRLARTAELAKYKVSCTSTSLVVENGTDKERALELNSLRLGAITELGDQLYEIGPLEPQRFTLAPGARGTVTLKVADWLARPCKFAPPEPTKAGDVTDIFKRSLDEGFLVGPVPRPLYCGFAFSFSAREVGTDTTLHAQGRCVPPTPTDPRTSGALELTR